MNNIARTKFSVCLAVSLAPAIALAPPGDCVELVDDCNSIDCGGPITVICPKWEVVNSGGVIIESFNDVPLECKLFPNTISIPCSELDCAGCPVECTDNQCLPDGWVSLTPCEDGLSSGTCCIAETDEAVTLITQDTIKDAISTRACLGSQVAGN